MAIIVRAIINHPHHDITVPPQASLPIHGTRPRNVREGLVPEGVCNARAEYSRGRSISSKGNREQNRRKCDRHDLRIRSVYRSGTCSGDHQGEQREPLSLPHQEE